MLTPQKVQLILQSMRVVESDLVDAEQHILTLRSKNDTLTRQVQDNHREMEDHRQLIATLQDQCSQYRSAVDQALIAETEASKIIRAHQQVVEDKERFAEECRVLGSQLSTLQALYQTVLQEKEDLVVENQCLVVERTRLTQQVDRMKKMYQTTAEDLCSSGPNPGMQNLQSVQDLHISALKKKIMGAAKQIEAFKAQLEQRDKDALVLQERVESLYGDDSVNIMQLDSAPLAPVTKRAARAAAGPATTRSCGTRVGALRRSGQGGSRMAVAPASPIQNDLASPNVTRPPVACSYKPVAVAAISGSPANGAVSANTGHKKRSLLRKRDDSDSDDFELSDFGL